jgi:hypothetical protein
LLFCSLLWVEQAVANDAEKTAAIAAFDEARELMQAGQIAQACEKFSQSYGLDEQLGSLLHLADCYEQNGQLASAWSAFRDAGDWAEKEKDSRVDLARQRAAALNPRLSKLELKLVKEMPAGATITRNGTALPRSLWNTAVPLDPGKYEIVVSAEGWETWSQTIEISGEAQLRTVEIPALEPAATQQQPSRKGPMGVQPAETADKQPTFGQEIVRKWPVIPAAAVAVTGGVIWSVFGVQSIIARNRADDTCGERTQCIDDGVDLRDEAYKSGNVATVGMVITLAGVATTGALWFLLPTDGNRSKSALGSPEPLRVGFTPTGVVVGGRL